MYEDNAAGGMVPQAYPAELSAKQRRLDVTLRQNIDQQIAQAQKHVASLEDAKKRMESSGILDMRIDDIQSAMRW